MALWEECPDCKGTGGYWDFHSETSTWAQKWVSCEPCEGFGKVRIERPVGPVDDMEEECARG